MDHERFRDWFSRVDELTATQRKEVAAVLSDPPEGAASLAAIELGVDDERRCPHCDAGGAVSRGKARGLRRFRCKECGKTFGALTGTALSGLHHKERWLSFGASLAEGETIKESAERCGIAPSTARRQGPQTRPLARAGADPGRRRPWRRDPQPYPAGAQRGQREAGAGADPRPGCAARFRRKPLLSARRGGARHPSREHQRLGWRAGPGRAAHPDCQQPPQPDQELPAWAARHRHQVPRQLSQVVPSHRTRRSAIAQSVP